MNNKWYQGVRSIAIGLTMLCFGTVAAQSFPWQDPSRPVDERIGWLIDRLSIDEKLSLMVHQNPAIERLGLPAYSWWNEALHGVGRAGLATVYPMPIALAATFSTNVVNDVFTTVAYEARRKHQEAMDTGYFGDYSGVTFFTPNINIFRDPRWGRGMETYGEDPYLTARMGLACVQGLQESGVGACLKHLAVHSGPEGVRHEFDSKVSERDLRTTYLPAFEYIIKHSDVAQVMCGYNRLNGLPCCTNRYLFDILRHEWQYDGLLVTDCWALNDAYELDTVIPRHRTHASAPLAYGDAFGSEVDLECGSGLPALKQAVEYGYIPESKIDEHLYRILKLRLAVAESVPPSAGDVFYTNPVDVAAQSMVMLKNNGVLPLKSDAQLRLEGPNMWDSLMPLGNYNGTPRHTVTLGEALSPFVSAAAPVVIYAGGLNPQLEGEELSVEKEGFYRGDRTRIELPKEQVDDLRSLKAQGYRVVLVLCTGSAIALENAVDLCDAVLVAWYGGEAMGTAVKQLLFGERDDFGRLPVTFYRSTSQLPDFEDYDMQRRTYRYMDEKPLFPFGYGLNYGHAEMGDITVFDETNEVQGIVELENPIVDITRIVLQLYLKDADIGEGKRLIGTTSVLIPSYHSHTGFRIAIDPFWLRRFNPASGCMEEPDEGTVMTLLIGFSSDDKDLIEIPYKYHRQ